MGCSGLGPAGQGLSWPWAVLHWSWPRQHWAVGRCWPVLCLAGLCYALSMLSVQDFIRWAGAGMGGDCLSGTQALKSFAS